MTNASRNIVAKSLGALWLLDGLLQLQPQMFGPEFVTNILTPLLNNQPTLLHLIVTWGIQLWSTNTIITNTAAALLQVAIGLLLLCPLPSKKFKAGLWISIIWGIVVWFCGEGAGQLFTGSASFYTGAPGAVLLYILLGVLLLIPEKVHIGWYPKIAGGTFILGSLLQLQSSLWAATGAQGNFMTAMMDPFHLVSTLPNHIYVLVGLNPIPSNLLLVVVPFLVGLVLLFKPNRITGTTALVFLFFVWWLGQDFGQLSTLIVGTPTDPNTAPLLALLVLPVFFTAKKPLSDRLS